MQLPQSLPWDLASFKWSSILNPLLANPLNQVIIVKNVFLKNGSTTFNHGLGRTPQGWFLVDINGSANVYRGASFNELTLTLISSAAVTASIGVF
jgi:hypothetical protein